jgi:hypothetical protein
MSVFEAVGDQQVVAVNEVAVDGDLAGGYTEVVVGLDDGVAVQQTFVLRLRDAA